MRKRPKDETKAKVKELLELVGLGHLGDRYPSQLSGGQRQRMALARALAVEPQVLLLDEPFGALDARVREELRRWLRRLHDDVHVTTIFVTHDQEEAMEISEQIVVVNEGRIEQSATPAEIYDKPATPFVMGFVGPVTRVGGALVRPHDVQISPSRARRRQQAVVTRLVVARLRGPRRAAARPRASAVAQLSRTEADGLELTEGQIVHVRVDPTRARREPTPAHKLPACASPPRPTTPCAPPSSWPPRPTTSRSRASAIATAQAIPLRFLENILMQLRHAGLVDSRRGADGGYKLARPAADVDARRRHPRDRRPARRRQRRRGPRRSTSTASPSRCATSGSPCAPRCAACWST